jgi:hypothetical protein
MAARVVTVNDILDGHVGLDLECFDRIYLNEWVPNLQVPGQVVNFLTHHLGFPIPSPAILEKIGLRFRRDVAEFAADHDIPVLSFAKGERKLEVMRPHLDRLIGQGRTGWPRSARRRSSSGCSPAPPIIPSPMAAGRCGSAITRPTDG